MLPGELGQQKWREHFALLDRHAPFRNLEYTLPDPDNVARHVSVSGRPIFDDAGRFMGYRGTTTDLTAQREAEERLHQTQKMDAIGQLTGGIAHDFNNILTVIMGIGEVLQESLADRPQLATTAKLIGDAATRGAALTQQLLAFARRQMLAPRATDVNALVSETVKLLRSTLGAQIEIQVTPQRDAWPAMIDPSQLSTALLNLAVNARDAMPNGGKLMIETSNVVLDGASAKADPEINARILRSGFGNRYRLGDSGCEPRQGVRAILYHQAGRQGDGSWPQHGLWVRQTVGRPRHDHQ